MYRLHVLLGIAILYFGAHLIGGYLECEHTFCPGDREQDWVYEFKDEDGKRFVMIDGAPISREIYDQKFDSRSEK